MVEFSPLTHPVIISAMAIVPIYLYATFHFAGVSRRKVAACYVCGHRVRAADDRIRARVSVFLRQSLRDAGGHGVELGHSTDSGASQA